MEGSFLMASSSVAVLTSPSLPPPEPPDLALSSAPMSSDLPLEPPDPPDPPDPAAFSSILFLPPVIAAISPPQVRFQDLGMGANFLDPIFAFGVGMAFLRCRDVMPSHLLTVSLQLRKSPDCSDIAPLSFAGSSTVTLIVFHLSLAQVCSSLYPAFPTVDGLRNLEECLALVLWMSSVLPPDSKASDSRVPRLLPIGGSFYAFVRFLTAVCRVFPVFIVTGFASCSFHMWQIRKNCLSCFSPDPPECLARSTSPVLKAVWSLAPTTPGMPCDLLQDVISGFVRAKQQTGLPPTGSQLLSRTIASDVVCCRCGEIETIVPLLFNCPFARKVWSLAPTTPGLPCDLLQDVRSGFVRTKKQTDLPPTGLGSCRTTFPQIWISDPNSASLMPFVGPNPFSLPSSSFLKERTISHVSSSELVWSLYRCICVARSSPVCEVCCSEISFSGIFKGSSNWCLVAFGIVAELMIVFSGLVAKAISNNRPLLVGIVSHGTFSPPASHVVKDRGLCDDLVCLRIGTVCLYLFIYCSYAFSLALVTILLLILMVLNFMFVTNSSRVGE